MNEIERKIVWAAIEDYAGLWELIWEISSLNPKIPQLENIKVVKEIIKKYIDNDIIDIYENIWGEKEYFLVQNNLQLLNQSSFWEPPLLGEKCLTISCTGKGIEYYNSFQ